MFHQFSCASHLEHLKPQTPKGSSNSVSVIVSPPQWKHRIELLLLEKKVISCLPYCMVTKRIIQKCTAYNSHLFSLSSTSLPNGRLQFRSLRCYPRSRHTSGLCNFLRNNISLRYNNYSLPSLTTMTTSISVALLEKQNAETSNALMEYWKDSKDFKALAEKEGTLTLQRDDEDGIKLQVGIDYAKSKGVIDPNYVPEPYVTIDVLGKTPDEVADTILNHVEEKEGNSSGGTGMGGSVIVLCGLSGTGKGTTVSKLSHKLQDQKGKQVVTWSNGNIFRSVTLLAATYCEQQQKDGEAFDITKALTKENLADFMSMLSFGKFGDSGSYDTRIQGLGLDLLVSQVQNTDLKSPKVSKNIPTVAEKTQGEVILFAAKAVEIMKNDGLVVLLEGREQTVNYVRTPHRFTLTLSDSSLIGKRRAAQRLMAEALSNKKHKLDASSTEEDVAKVLEACLEEMVKEE